MVWQKRQWVSVKCSSCLARDASVAWKEVRVVHFTFHDVSLFWKLVWMRFLWISPVLPPVGSFLVLLISYRGGSTKAASKPFSRFVAWGQVCFLADDNWLCMRGVIASFYCIAALIASSADSYSATSFMRRWFSCLSSYFTSPFQHIHCEAKHPWDLRAEGLG